jgi:hypothetical protein
VYLIAPNNMGLYCAILHVVVDYYSLSQYLSQLPVCNQINLSKGFGNHSNGSRFLLRLLLLAYLPIPHTNFTKPGSPKSMTSIKLLYCAKSSPTKVYGFGTLNLVTTVWKTSFTILLEHLPPELEIAGSL